MSSPVRTTRRMRAACTAVPLLAGVALSACAAVPHSTVGAGPAPVSQYETAQSLQDAPGQWPQADWWRAYGDSQLSALIEEALSGAPDMRAAEARLARARAMVTTTRSGMLPSLSANGSVQYAQQSETLGLPIPKGWDDNGRATADLSWDLDFWGRNRAALAAATSDALAAEAERSAAALALSAAIAADYAGLAGQFADRDAIADAVKVRRSTADLMRERQSQGLENEGAVQRALAAVAAAEADLAAAEEGIALTRNRIAALLGKGPDRGLAIARPEQVAPIASGLPDDLPAELLGRRPDIAAARLRVQSASKRIDVAEKAFYPNINLAAFVGLQSLNLSTFTDGGSFIGSAGPAVSLPIFQGGRLRGQYRAAEADFDAAVAAYDGAVARGLQDVADAVASRRALDARLKHSRAAQEAAERAWTVADNRYRGGLSSYLEVLDAQDAMISARRAVALLETRAFALDVALIRALGGGFGA